MLSSGFGGGGVLEADGSVERARSGVDVEVEGEAGVILIRFPSACCCCGVEDMAVGVLCGKVDC